MKTCGSRVVTGLALLLGAVLADPGTGRGQSTAYLDFQQFTGELRSLVEPSSLAAMESLGTTLEGREIWVVTVGDPSGSALDTRPGVLVVGNLEGDHLAGSQITLEAIRHLLANSGAEAVRSQLSDKVFYFFPRLNPDGAEAMFARVKQNRRTNARPWDEDNDGRTDEDGPEDLNGDGYITVMRVPDAGGRFMVDPSDPRAMKRADPTKGESGSYTLYWEGTDEDGDGFINEDGPGGVDLNRNFQHAYPYWTGDAGPHMVSEPESRALMNFVLAHRNIAVILAFGASDNLVTPPDSDGKLAECSVPLLPLLADSSFAEVFARGVLSTDEGSRRGGGARGGGGGDYLRGAQPGRDNDPGSGTRPAVTVAGQDQVYFKAVSDLYRRVTGVERVPLHRTPEGAFFQYGYFQFGVPSFSTPGWGLPEGDTDAEGGDDAALLQALDSAGIQAFADWTSFQHPELGEVEIGGFLPYLTHNPPADHLPELGRKHGEFLVELADMLPRVRFTKTEVKAHGDGVFTVEAEVENAGFLPTSLRHGQTSRSVGPTFLQIQIDDDDILTGADKTARIGVLAGSGSRESVTWVIRGQEGSRVEIRLHSEKSGRDTTTVTLR